MAADTKCSKCGGTMNLINNDTMLLCPYCDESVIVQEKETTIIREFVTSDKALNDRKKKKTAMLLGLFLGGFGIDKFYLNKTKQGFIFVIFWILLISLTSSLIGSTTDDIYEEIIITYVFMVIYATLYAIICGISFFRFFLMGDKTFDEKYNNDTYKPRIWISHESLTGILKPSFYTSKIICYFLVVSIILLYFFSIKDIADDPYLAKSFFIILSCILSLLIFRFSNLSLPRQTEVTSYICIGVLAVLYLNFIPIPSVTFNIMACIALLGICASYMYIITRSSGLLKYVFILNIIGFLSIFSNNFINLISKYYVDNNYFANIAFYSTITISVILLFFINQYNNSRKVLTSEN